MSIDWWTLGIQTVNVLILIWLLQRFFWRPIAAMIEQRRTATQQTLAAAMAAQDKVAAFLAEIAQTRAGFGKERDTILATAHAEADHARIATLDEAAKQVTARDAAASMAIEKEQADAETAWSERASQLAVEIAGRLAARLQGSEVRAAFLDWLLTGIRSLPGPARQSAAADGMILEAISATAVAPADQDRYRTLIGEAFGAHPQITFKEDPELIAGLELRGPHFTVGNSWQADLSDILADLKHAPRR
jgi:F-type H+-transporting ATPase subunit b